jgi:hypothetical protein
VYNLTDNDEPSDEMYQNQAWMSEYERVCNLPVDGPFPTVGFNFSITLTDADSSAGSSMVDTSSQTASPQESSTATTATSTTSAETPTSTVSENGLCGASNRDGLVLVLSLGIVVANTVTVVVHRTTVQSRTAMLLTARVLDFRGCLWN